MVVRRSIAMACLDPINFRRHLFASIFLYYVWSYIEVIQIINRI